MNHQDKFTVTLGDYQGIKYPKLRAEVADGEVAAFLQREVQKHISNVTVDAPAENGNTVVIDFAGFLGEEQFEGGTSENYPLQLGSHSFIPGFEEQLVGACAGDEVDVHVTFPENYQAENLAGKPVVFKCKVHEVQKQVVPELNDEFAQKHYQLENLAALEKAAHDSILAQKDAQNRNQIQEIVMSKVVAGSEITIAEDYMKDCVEQMMNYFRRNLASQGLTAEMYCQYTGLTMDGLKDKLRPQAESSAKVTAVLTAIADKEQITISDEEFAAELGRMAQSYHMTVDELKTGLPEESYEGIRMGMATSKALDLVISAAVEE